MVQKELYLQAYGHSGVVVVFKLHLMFPDYKNALESQEICSESTWGCPPVLLAMGGQGIGP